MTTSTLERVHFTHSRELEFFSKSELTRQTGQPEELWTPGVLSKELIDNALDACEQVGVSPEIEIQFATNFLEVSDNGPGIPASVVRRIRDFSTTTSDKRAWISPTRGAQGNALKTVIAIPFVLSGNRGSKIEITARGIQHSISVSTDTICQRPRITHQLSQVVKSDGTCIRVPSFSPCSKSANSGVDFLQKMILDYSLFNPHATFTLNGQKFAATKPAWKKWMPTDPTSPHWYNDEQFEFLVASYLSPEQRGANLTVRELVAFFRGLSGTAKQHAVCEASRLSRSTLRSLAADGKLDRESIQRLLRAMKNESKPVKPESLGVLGEEHFRLVFESDPGTSSNTFRYSRQKGFDEHGLPFLIECAFAIVSGKSRLRGLHTGLNWSVPLGQPLQQSEFSIGKEGVVEGLTAALAKNRIDVRHDPVCLAIHLSCPRFNFLDRGKGSVAL